MRQNDGKPGLARKYEVFEETVSGKSLTVYKETSDGDVDRGLAVVIKYRNRKSVKF